jgi:hypothetical protein
MHDMLHDQQPSASQQQRMPSQELLRPAQHVML